jgi:hypothetical protein
MRGDPEVLTWSSRPDARDQVEGEGPIGEWVDFGDLRQATGDGDDGRGPGQPTGRFPRVPRALSWGVVVAALAALVVPALRSPAASGTSADNPGIKDNVTRSDADDVEQYPPWSPPQPTQLPLPERVVTTARDAQPLRDQVRPGGTRGDCPRPPRPQLAMITRAIKAIDETVKGVRLKDSSQLRDSFGELCLLQVRAHDAHGTQYVLTVVPPERWPGVHTQELQTLQSQRFGTSYVRTVSEMTPTGWRVDLGALGAEAKLPTLGALGDIAVDPLLTW